MRRLALLVALVLAAASPAWAHADLENAVPRVGSAIAVPPAEIRLQFSDDVRPSLCTVRLSARSGAAVPLGPLAAAPGDDSVLVAAVKARLGPGVYRVEWHVVAEEGHRTEGSFTFEVRPQAQSAQNR